MIKLRTEANMKVKDGTITVEIDVDHETASQAVGELDETIKGIEERRCQEN